MKRRQVLEYDGIEYGGLPVKPVVLHQMNQLSSSLPRSTVVAVPQVVVAK
jgi:hypothetical protein